MSGTLAQNPTETVVTVAQFRTILPSFADSSIFLNEQVSMWLNLGASLLDPCRWAELLPLGISLFAAHQMTLERNAYLASQRGTSGGSSFGLVTSKAINGVSVSYDTGAIAIAGGGDYNLTIYGVRFLTMARMLGMGGIQLSPWPIARSVDNFPNASLFP